MILFLYLIIFATGAVIGSFCTLAVYRLPIRKDITHERSFCPKCNHKLNFLDLIPILSYVCLGGKCRYCKDKIRPRYLIIEILAGLIAIIYTCSLRFNLQNIEIDKIVNILIGLCYITGIVIIAGIDKEKKQIQKSVLVYNTIVTALYIIYLFIVGNTNINRYAIYLFFMFALLIVHLMDKRSNKTREKPLGFYIGVLNIITLIAENFILYYS